VAFLLDWSDRKRREDTLPHRQKGTKGGGGHKQNAGRSDRNGQVQPRIKQQAKGSRTGKVLKQVIVGATKQMPDFVEHGGLFC